MDDTIFTCPARQTRPDAKAEVLRYLGHRGQEIGEDLSARVDKAMAECRALSRPRVITRRFPLAQGADGAFDIGAGLALAGKTAAAQLAGAAGAALLAATLGYAPERRVAAAQLADITYALLLDAAATQYIEEICDSAQAALRAGLAAEGLHLGARFSPGYGDLPLTLQGPLLTLLDAPRRAGLSRTGRDILTPRKSVTAVMGIFSAPPPPPACGCAHCPLRETCLYKSG